MSRAASTASLRTRLRRFRRSRRGSTAVEFALVAPVFFALLFAIIETAMVFFASQVLETITSDSARLIMTGQAQTAAMDQATFKNVVCAHIPALFTCGNFKIDVETYASFSAANASAPTLTFNANGSVANTWQFAPGGPNDIVVVRAMYQWPVFLGPLGLNLSNLSNGNRLLVGTSVFKNEPY